MIDHWKGLALEITNFDYQDDRTPSAEIIPSQTSNFWTCRDYECFTYIYLRKIIGKILSWGSQISIINMTEHTQLKPYPLKPQTLNIKRSQKFKLLLSLIHHWKCLDLEITHFDYHYDRTRSVETIRTQTSKS